MNAMSGTEKTFDHLDVAAVYGSQISDTIIKKPGEKLKLFTLHTYIYTVCHPFLFCRILIFSQILQSTIPEFYTKLQSYYYHFTLSLFHSS